MNEDTICALSTGVGQAAVAIIRVSGPNAREIAGKSVRLNKKGLQLPSVQSNTLHVGGFFADGELLDNIVVSVFHAPHSFTGDDVVEINCHGSAYVKKRILETLVANGARMARPGEFTQRAFLNGKMDLIQAEAIADLIAATTHASQRLAMNQMRGGFSADIATLRARLLNFISLLELELDFSEEDVNFANRNELKTLVGEIHSTVTRLLRSFALGNVIKSGVPVAIIGETNVGKSTLLNALVNDDRAIVSDIHGTTRDVIEDVINIHDVTFRFFDTAGLRETIDVIEKMGIERTYTTLRVANIVLLVIDTTNPLPLVLWRINKIRELVQPWQHLIIIANKIDIGNARTIGLLRSVMLGAREEIMFLSANNQDSLEMLKNRMCEIVAMEAVNQNETIVANARHRDALQRASDALTRVEAGMEQQVSGEFLTRDIRCCLDALGEITGEITNDEVLGNIFAKFCIGK
ncbi:MAG: tRNA uridine-5-carboxymethylaminomethyl(34) synthesis GTPase MnmE [Bacteroidales bacterium]|jgi:tRNA modification GTPase|nr:tRNA uridine-5-carboxymethylaminomethyl(34) synthesis GTPase MnmE [Bacteroidales bacterium]